MASSPAVSLAGVPVLCGVIALECRMQTDGGSKPALPQDEAGRLAQWLGRDLASLHEDVAELDLVLGAAHFDPAEALRPGWPLHRRLLDILQRAPQRTGQARVIGLGADRSGHVPQPLLAEVALLGGALRVLPWLLHGEPDTVMRVATVLEAQLLDRGMLGADAALLLQEHLHLPIEHARCLTLHDLLALTAMQYGHQGLEGFWPLLETALLRPQDTAALDAPPEPLARYANGIVHITLPSLPQWQQRCAGDETDPERLQQGHAMHAVRARQLAAIARVHGLDTTLETATPACT